MCHHYIQDEYNGDGDCDLGAKIDCDYCVNGGGKINPMKTRIPNTVMKNGKRYVCRIFDNGGKTIDRYTIALKGYRIPGYGMVYPYLAASEYPFQSFGLHGESREFLKGKHLGKRILFESLPADVQRFIMVNIGKEE